jgi:hypothetical protein
MFAAAQAPSNSSPSLDSQKCAMLTRLNLEDTPGGPAMITSARLVDVPGTGLDGGTKMLGGPLGGLGSSALLSESKVKQYCEVIGYVAPQNKFNLRLPLKSNWNQKFLFTACGGMCGDANGVVCNPGLARGYASVTANGGHEGSFGFDGVWAANAGNLQEDYSWRGNHVVTLVTKSIVTQYYEQAIKYSYMTGCSKGGQAVLVEAQRFPEDYDGLMPVAPVYDMTGRNIAAAWFAQAVSDGRGGSVLNGTAAAAVNKSVLSLCGAQSGVDEGLVTDPGTCKWQPEMIGCADDVASSTCLTRAQVAAVKRLMTSVTNSKGEVLYAYPYIPGTETSWGGWNFAGPGGVPPHLNNKASYQFLSYLADETPRKHIDPLKFNFDTDPTTLTRARRIYDATSYDLRAFKARGGKMLLWHGLADGGIMATSSIGYYQGVKKLMGGTPQIEEFFRMFLVPGVHHCNGGPGLTEFDVLTLLEEWVENGKAPEMLLTARRDDKGNVERTRPVYPYPVQARYSGAGDPKQAASFVPAGSSLR